MVKAASFIPIIAGLIGAANAHTRVYGLWVNGEFQGDGRDIYIRSPPTNDPVKVCFVFITFIKGF
jgi:cellulase